MVNSIYPTFRIIYTKGVKDIFQSSADFDYLEFGMGQTVDLDIFSELGWNVKTGRYLNKKHIHFPDFKHYMELGYGLSDIFLVADAGIFFGFENGKYERFGFRLNLKFGE